MSFADITTTQWLLALTGAFCLGFSKTGFPGLAMVNVLLIAELFGAKASVGIILPLLIVCDLTVYPLFRKYSSWKALANLLPSIFAGLAAGYFLLDYIDESTARRSIGAIVLLMFALQMARLWLSDALGGLSGSTGFRWGSGLMIGVSTMMANAAGPVFSIYALARKMTKETFLGMGARCFLLVNLLKVPLLADLELINGRSLGIDLLLLPGVFAGIFLGRKMIRLLPQRLFELLLYVFSFLAGARLLFF